MKNTEKIKVEILYAGRNVTLRENYTFNKPVKLTEIQEIVSGDMANYWNETGNIAIDNLVVKDNVSIHESTRIVILRALINDPKELRRKRAKQTKKP